MLLITSSTRGKHVDMTTQRSKSREWVLTTESLVPLGLLGLGRGGLLGPGRGGLLGPGRVFLSSLFVDFVLLLHNPFFRWVLRAGPVPVAAPWGVLCPLQTEPRPEPLKHVDGMWREMIDKRDNR